MSFPGTGSSPAGELEASMRTGAAALGLSLTPEQEKQFRCYLELLRRWNRAHNLTTVTVPAEIVNRHFLDSLAYNCLLPASIDGSILDLGSGAGFPGLPLAIVRPKDHFLLVEARRKKVLFLQEVIRRLRLSRVESIHLHLHRGNARTELRKPVAVVVARAVSPGEEVLPAADALLDPGALLLLSATAGSREEFHRLLAAAGKWRLRREMAVTVPFLAQKRYLLQAEKTA